MSVKFTQSCPTCGRRIRIRASLLGYTVACQHCRAEFVAQNDLEPLDGTAASSDEPSASRAAQQAATAAIDPLMQRVEKLLSHPSTL